MDKFFFLFVVSFNCNAEFFFHSKYNFDSVNSIVHLGWSQPPNTDTVECPDSSVS